jgi:hypothetical protein
MPSLLGIFAKNMAASYSGKVRPLYVPTLWPNVYMRIIKFLLTEREVFTEKYLTEVFFVQTEPMGEVCTKRPSSDISLSRPCKRG